MNKKQLIVAWILGGLICVSVLFAPKVIIPLFPGKSYNPVSYKYKLDLDFIEKIKWEIAIQQSLVILIIGGLLIYTLRDKKK